MICFQASRAISSLLTFSLSHLLTGSFCLAASAALAPQSQPASQPSEGHGLVIRLAHSKDGLTFIDSKQVLLQGATSPDLLRVPNGDLLALFTQDAARPLLPPSQGGARGGEAELGRGEPQTRPSSPALAVSRSKDGGKTWSPARPIRLTSPQKRPVQATRGSLILMPDGSGRLYFVRERTPGSAQDDAKTRRPTEIASATTRNGLDYELDSEFKLAVRLPPDPRPVAVLMDKQVHLYIAGRTSPDRRAREEVLHFTSADGRRFERADPIRAPGFSQVSDIILDGKKLRAYVSARDGIRSMISTDGVKWEPEKDLRLPKATDLTVTSLKDSGHLALYCTPADTATCKQPQLAAASEKGASPAAENPSDASATGEQAGKLSDAEESWEPFGPGLNEPNSAALDAASADANGASNKGTAGGGAGGQTAGSDQPDLFPPKPDFKNQINYAQWCQDQLPTSLPDNADPDYQALQAEWDNPPGVKPAGWPDGVNDMFNGVYTGPIGPWDPAQHPEWEQTHQALSGFLDRFSAATWHQYWAPVLENQPTADGYPLLANITLRHLGDNRAWVKAALADAWRAQDGKVPPQQMLDRLGAALRNSTLLGQTPTMIHHLVSIAEQRLAEDNARLALQHNVFTTPEELAAAYNLLAQNDLPPPDPAHWFRTEAAFGMDVLQYAFPPDPSGGEARLNLERAAHLGSIIEGASSEGPMPAEYANLTAEDARQAVDVLDKFCREVTELWRTGYPQVKIDHVEELTNKYRQENPLLAPLLPSFGRAYEIGTRVEANRRATQLTYAVHLFKAQAGRWPSSLAEIPAEYGATIRTDPFTGGYFGYQLSESGPKIYSLGHDGLDSGGVHSKNWGDDRKSGTDSDDFVFWPPD